MSHSQKISTLHNTTKVYISISNQNKKSFVRHPYAINHTHTQSRSTLSFKFLSLPNPTLQKAKCRTYLVPVLDLHRAVLLQVLVHVERLEQQVRLVAHALAQALELGLVEVVLQDRLVVGVRALLDDDAGALLG